MCGSVKRWHTGVMILALLLAMLETDLRCYMNLPMSPSSPSRHASGLSRMVLHCCLHAAKQSLH